MRITLKCDLREENVELLGHSFDIKTLLTNGLQYSLDILIPIFAGTIISSISKKDKHLTIQTVKRAIIAESPENLPFSMKDEDGNSIYNCYCIDFRVWNKGKKDIRGQDISQAKPFILEIGNGAKVLGQPFFSRDDIGLNVSDLEDGKFKIDFDFINSDEWVEISFYVTGNPNTRVSASGRIAGQNLPEFDVSIDDGKASLWRRLSALLVMLLMILPLICLLVGLVWLLRLSHEHLLQGLWLEADRIPKNLVFLLMFGSMLPMLCLYNFGTLWIARRNHPKNYPLEVDYQPKLIQKFLGHWNVFWKGKRFLISNSSYNYGEIFFPNQEDS
jgi:hypothetical protein